MTRLAIIAKPVYDTTELKRGYDRDFEDPPFLLITNPRGKFQKKKNRRAISLLAQKIFLESNLLGDPGFDLGVLPQ